MGLVSNCSGKALRGAVERWLGAIKSAGAFLILASALTVPAQQPADAPTGSLSGKLTDLHSRPVDGAMLVLRNAITGVEAKTTTSKSGSYHFSSLQPGEYSLAAVSPRMGQGQIAGIYVSAGHESRVRAALELSGQPSESLVRPDRVRSYADPVSPPLDMPETTDARRSPIVPPHGADGPAMSSPRIEASLAFELIQTLPLLATNRPLPVPDRILIPSPSNNPRNAPVDDIPSVSVDSRALLAVAASPLQTRPAIKSAVAPPNPPSLAAVTINLAASTGVNLAIAGVSAAHGAAQLGRTPPPVLLASHASAPETEATLSGQQLQALPLAGRHWEDFVLDSPAARTEPDEEKPASTAGRTPPSVSVDSANIRLAFGGRAGGRMRSASLMGPGANEAAISEVRTYEKTGDLAYESQSEHATVETRVATDQFHGQGFLFDRRNLWGARNPFTPVGQRDLSGNSWSHPCFHALPVHRARS